MRNAAMCTRTIFKCQSTRNKSDKVSSNAAFLARLPFPRKTVRICNAVIVSRFSFVGNTIATYIHSLRSMNNNNRQNVHVILIPVYPSFESQFPRHFYTSFTTYKIITIIRFTFPLLITLWIYNIFTIYFFTRNMSRN